MNEELAIKGLEVSILTLKTTNKGHSSVVLTDHHAYIPSQGRQTQTQTQRPQGNLEYG